MSAVLVFAPTETEIREDADLMARISEATARLAGEAAPAPPASRAAHRSRPAQPDSAGRGLGSTRLADWQSPGRRSPERP
jgi:hypothetical protein